MRVLTAMALLATPLWARAQTQQLTVEDVVRLALQHNSHVMAQEEFAQSAELSTLSLRGSMLPAVHLSDEFQHFDSPFAISFGPQSLTAREQDTNTFTASVSQPLLGLFTLREDYAARKDHSAAAHAGVDDTAAATREWVQTEYLHLFEARALEALATNSEGELREQVVIAEAQVKAGVLTHADLLRVRVAMANAKQQTLVAHTQGRVARANLLGAINLPPDDTQVEFVEPTTLLDPPPEPAPTLEQTLQHRGDYQQLQLRAGADHHAAQARWWALLPTLNAEGAYVRIKGQVFAPPQQWYVGLNAHWAVWEWGADWYAHEAAAALSRSSDDEVEQRRQKIGVEIVSRRAQLEAATSAVALARETIDSAEEAYRVTEAALKSGTATTTDVLDAQAALTQARLNLARARYQEAIANVSLKRAEGTHSP